jgi:hypothetical protein
VVLMFLIVLKNFFKNLQTRFGLETLEIVS